MSAQHTPGRLVVRPHGGNWSASYEGYGATAYMGIVSDTGEVVALATAYSPNPFNEPEGPDENARRMVACWNACDGVPTELLEACPAPFTELRTQRDELLEALDELSQIASVLQAVCLGDERAKENRLDRALAAIAKVKGGAA